ncbi:hypothetical protein [Nocardia ninae]|uniref:Uncharacterized protein n=1 Tax=Nocardia ninae NBRC 108245 TaxID=1210091 RepID=A0A511MP02_9NOCA|nr:hypothetical protein [Nocardia ninae]GEM42181.1 hypothetical protein NN4_67000 [Nocardia ninae NBRC 108245]
MPLTEADATGGWLLHEHPSQGLMLTRQLNRRQLTVWEEDGRLYQFVVESSTTMLKWGRRSTVAAAKAAAEKAARPPAAE